MESSMSVESLDELKDRARMYDTAIERHKKVIHDATTGRLHYSEISKEKFHALAKGNLKILLKDRLQLRKMIEDQAKDTK